MIRDQNPPHPLGIIGPLFEVGITYGNHTTGNIPILLWTKLAIILPQTIGWSFVDIPRHSISCRWGPLKFPWSPASISAYPCCGCLVCPDSNSCSSPPRPPVSSSIALAAGRPVFSDASSSDFLNSICDVAALRRRRRRYNSASITIASTQTPTPIPMPAFAPFDKDLLGK